MTTLDAVVLIRPAEATDLDYIHKSWISSYGGTEWGRRVGQHYKRDHIDLVIAPLLHFSASRIIVAASASDPSFILCWMLHTETALHYVCTRQKYARAGVATRLLASLPSSVRWYSHISRSFDGLRQVTPALQSLSWRPYLMFEGIHDTKEYSVLQRDERAPHPSPVERRVDEQHRSASAVGNVGR